jgi:hypothetical protein
MYIERLSEKSFWQTGQSRDIRSLKILPFWVDDLVIFYYLRRLTARHILFKSIIINLFYVVHHAIKQPLDIDFYFSSEGKPILQVFKKLFCSR